MLLLAAWVSPAAPAQERKDFPVNGHHIVYHDVKTDANGEIVPWYNDSPAVAYDLRRSHEHAFLQDVP
jgi:hypothetical protein